MVSLSVPIKLENSLHLESVLLKLNLVNIQFSTCVLVSTCEYFVCKYCVVFGNQILWIFSLTVGYSLAFSRLNYYKWFEWNELNLLQVVWLDWTGAFNCFTRLIHFAKFFFFVKFLTMTSLLDWDICRGFDLWFEFENIGYHTIDRFFCNFVSFNLEFFSALYFLLQNPNMPLVVLEWIWFWT